MRALIAIVVFALITAGPGRPSYASGSATLYLALGDSLAEGFGASHPSLTGYVPRIFRYVHAAANGGIDTSTNLARGGESTTEMIGGGAPTAQLGLALDAIAATDTDTRMVTIHMGADDLFDDVFFKNADCIADPLGAACMAALAVALANVPVGLATILATLNAALEGEDGAVEPVYIFTYFNPWSGTGHPFEAPTDLLLLGADGTLDCAALSEPANAGLNDIVACTGALLGATAIDIYPLFEDRALELTNIASGDVHPNDEGYAVIASAFRRTLRSAD